MYVLCTAPLTPATVIDAYARSLRITFILAIAVFVAVNILMLTIRLPNLKPKKGDDASGDAEDGA